MMDKGSTLYDYTRSAEEPRVFELGETCSKIIHEYEMFNLQNDVYKMFGEWLLNEAKTVYEAVFTEKILNKFLKDKDLTKPGKVYIKAKKSDLQSCEKLRELTNSRCWDERWNGWGGFETDYAWYTLWKIAKAYNCQNGCVVVYFDRSGLENGMTFPVNESAYLMNDNGKTIQTFHWPVIIEQDKKALKDMGVEGVEEIGIKYDNG